MNWYLFALLCEGLIALLIVFGMILYTACQVALAKKKAEETKNMVCEICSETVGRTIHTMGEEMQDLMVFAMDKTKQMVDNTFKSTEES